MKAMETRPKYWPIIGYLCDYSGEEEPVIITVLISLIIIDKSELDQALGDGGGGDHLQHQPIRGQYSGHMMRIDQSEASILTSHSSVYLVSWTEF